MHEAILCLDIGTTTIKAVLIDLAGREVSVAEQALQLLTPRPGWAELDPEAIWQAVVRVTRAVQSAQAPEGRILAVALSSQGGSLVPTTDDGTPTYNAITWLDRRAEAIVAGWQGDGTSQWVRRISGWSPVAGLPLPSICWLRQALPDRFAATQRFLPVNDFVAHRLTGEFGTDLSMAGELLLADIRTGTWSVELCDLAGIEPRQLSPIVPSTAILGRVQAGASRLTGLPAGTPLVAGGQDHACEGLALGATAPGSLWLACGTAWVLNGAVDTPDVDEIPETMSLNPHVVPGRWIASQFLGALGAGMEWWVRHGWSGHRMAEPPDRQERYASFNAELRETEPGSAGLFFFPLDGSQLAAGETAAPGGFVGLRLDHTRADMGRALLESAAFEVRGALDHIRQAGLPLERLWLVGGATRNPLWPQIIADVTGVPLSLTRYSHGPALGAALLAGRGLGLWDESPSWVSAGRVEPDGTHADPYEEQFAAYRHLAGELYR
ncbi:MAG: FGGY family carbohydrate kinase [Anaerolineae bacterium]|jgi:xylulokinase